VTGQMTWRDAVRAHRWRLVALFAGVLAPLAVFGSLASEVWGHEGFAWDALVTAPLIPGHCSAATRTNGALTGAGER